MAQEYQNIHSFIKHILKKTAYVNIFKVTKNQDCKHSEQKTYFKNKAKTG